MSWNERFLASTRGRIVTLLRRASRTVEELAQALQLTDNAVRGHLATLERDGLVRQRGVRRGAGKPAFAYELTPEAERLYPKAYGPVLRQLLDVLSERTTPAELDELLRTVGRRIAAATPMQTSDPDGRIALALEVLAQLGGLAEVERLEDALIVRGYSCPLAEAVPGHPEVCRLAEALVSEVVGAPVRECCDRGARPACRFEIRMDPALLGETA